MHIFEGLEEGRIIQVSDNLEETASVNTNSVVKYLSMISKYAWQWDQRVVSNLKPHYFDPWVQVCMHCSFCSGRRTLERLWSPSLDLRDAFLNEDYGMEAMLLIAASIPIDCILDAGFEWLPWLQLVCAGMRGLARCAGLLGRTFSVVALVLLELPMPQTLLKPSQLWLWWLWWLSILSMYNLLHGFARSLHNSWLKREPNPFAFFQGVAELQQRQRMIPRISDIIIAFPISVLNVISHSNCF